jgi:hypothetical protein
MERRKPATDERLKTSHYQRGVCRVGCPAFKLESFDGKPTERGRSTFDFDVI